jgi:hypothetical protein
VEIEVRLPRLYPLQQSIVNDPARFKVICAGRRVGKTILVRHVAINAMLKGKRVCYITPTFILSDEAFDRIALSLPFKLITKSNKSSRQIEILGGGSIRFFSGEALSRARGFEADLILVDEASMIKDLQTEWNQSLRPLLLKTKGSAYFISTPFGKNYYYSLFVKGQNQEQGFKSWQFSSYENPYLDKKELDDLIKEMPEAVYQQEILAQPMANNANPFGVDNIIKNTVKELSKEPTLVYGIDLAKTSDWTVIIGLDANGHVTYLDRFQLPWVLTKSKIEALPADVQKVMDSTGVGDVLYEQLQSTCSNITGFKFTSSSKPDLMYSLIKGIEEGALKYPESVAQELHTMEYKYSSSGHLSFQAQSGYHDDQVMALAMAYNTLKEAKYYSNWNIYLA